MPLSSATLERIRQFLRPGEEIRYTFPATSLWRDAPLRMGHFIIVVTDASITVLSVALVGRGRPKSVWARYPRNTEIGLVQMAPGPVYRVRDLMIEVDEECVNLINAANAERPSPPHNDPRAAL